MLDLAVNVLDGLIVDLGLGLLQLVSARLELLVKLLDALEDGGARGLVALLRLADLAELGLQLGLALRVGGVFVGAAAAGEINLGPGSLLLKR